MESRLGIDRRPRRYCGVGEELAIGVAAVVVDAEVVEVQEGGRDVDQPRKQQNCGQAAATVVHADCDWIDLIESSELAGISSVLSHTAAELVCHYGRPNRQVGQISA